MGPIAASQYRDGSLDPSVQLFLSADPDDYLEQAELLERTSSRQASLLNSLQQKQRELAQTRAEAMKKLPCCMAMPEQAGPSALFIAGVAAVVGSAAWAAVLPCA